MSCCSQALRCNSLVVFQLHNSLLLLLPIPGLSHFMTRSLVGLARTDLKCFVDWLVGWFLYIQIDDQTSVKLRTVLGL